MVPAAAPARRSTPAALARDVAGLILELDLYNRPLCVAGEGLGAAVGLELAALRPKLVGLLFFVGLRGLPAAADPAWGPGMLSPPPRPPRSSVTPPGGLWCRLQGCGAFPSLAHLALALMQVAAGPCRCASAAGAARAARAMVRLEGSEGGGARRAGAGRGPRLLRAARPRLPLLGGLRRRGARHAPRRGRAWRAGGGAGGRRPGRRRHAARPAGGAGDAPGGSRAPGAGGVPPRRLPSPQGLPGGPREPARGGPRGAAAARG